MAKSSRTILGIDPGLAHTGWGVIRQDGSRLTCLAYGCVTTGTDEELASRLLKIKNQIAAVIERYQPSCIGIETVWFGQNITAAFGTGQARGAALVACAEAGLKVGEFTPNAIKSAVVGQGLAEKDQVQYMVAQILRLERIPEPDHAADALAAAICYVTHDQGVMGATAKALAEAQRGTTLGAKRLAEAAKLSQMTTSAANKAVAARIEATGPSNKAVGGQVAKALRRGTR